VVERQYVGLKTEVSVRCSLIQSTANNLMQAYSACYPQRDGELGRNL